MHAALLNKATHHLHEQIPHFHAAEEEDFSTWTEAFHLATLSDRCVTGVRQRGASGDHLLHGLTEGLQPCAGKLTGGVTIHTGGLSHATAGDHALHDVWNSCEELGARPPASMCTEHLVH